MVEKICPGRFPGVGLMVIELIVKPILRTVNGFPWVVTIVAALPVHGTT